MYSYNIILISMCKTFKIHLRDILVTVLVDRYILWSNSFHQSKVSELFIIFQCRPYYSMYNISSDSLLVTIPVEQLLHEGIWHYCEYPMVHAGKGQCTFHIQQSACRELVGSRRDNAWRSPLKKEYIKINSSSRNEHDGRMNEDFSIIILYIRIHL